MAGILSAQAYRAFKVDITLPGEANDAAFTARLLRSLAKTLEDHGFDGERPGSQFNRDIFSTRGICGSWKIVTRRA